MTNIVQANHGFTVSNQSGKSVFTYQKEKYQAKNLLPLLFTLGLLSLMSLLLVRPDSAASALFVWLLFTLGSFFLIKYVMNLNRKQGTFSIDKGDFEIEGSKYVKEHITSLFIQEGNSAPIANINMDHSGSTIVFNANLSGAMAASAVNAAHGIGKIGDAASDKLRKNIAKLNCKVFLRYGNKNIQLAKGITMDTAEVMLDKIVEISQSGN